MTEIKLIAYDHRNIHEAQEIYEIIQRYFKTSPWPPSVDDIRQGKIHYFRAKLGDHQVGMAGYVLKTPNLAETVKTVVFDEFRGQGLGEAISLTIEEECRRVGVKKVMTTIYHFNHIMIGIKLKQGYTIEGYHPDHEAPGMHEYSLGKKLA